MIKIITLPSSNVITKKLPGWIETIRSKKNSNRSTNLNEVLFVFFCSKCDRTSFGHTRTNSKMVFSIFCRSVTESGNRNRFFFIDVDVGSKNVWWSHTVKKLEKIYKSVSLRRQSLNYGQLLMGYPWKKISHCFLI